jgi:energy-coupling factor transport system ATP-binding protein
LEGFFAVADPRAVKVPFDIWLDRVRTGMATDGDEQPRAPMSPPNGAPPRLEWRGVSAAYDGRTVLYDVRATLGAREIVAVLGPNGSGKTTLFKTAIGLVPASTGEVLVDGASTAGRSVAELATVFGYVFQNPSQMLFAPNVREELLFGPRNLGRDPARIDGLVDTTLRRARLADEEGIAERPPLTLSFGQQKRLSTAVALALEPRTLVLDEPSAGQDHRNAATFMREVRRIEGLESVYFVTHDADLALANADRIILLRDGRVAADGTPLEVIADRERWTASNLRYTSLMEANVRWQARTGRFLDGAALAAVVAGEEAGASGRPEADGPASSGGLES